MPFFLKGPSVLRVLMLLGVMVPWAPAFAAEIESPGIVTRRLSLAQYRQAIADAFGPAITVGGRVEPDVRENGLLAIGAARLSVTATGMEQYDILARSIAAQVVSARNRATLIPCEPVSTKDADERCAREFLAQAGRLLYRRPLSADEITARTAVAVSAAKASKDFYTGLATALATTLVSPQFLFRHQTAEADSSRAAHQLDAFSKAAQLSFFLWNAAPDPELLLAAESGDLDTDKGLDRQVTRLIASPRLEAGVRAFFADMLGFEGLDALAKDPVLFRKYTTEVVLDAREQTLRTLVELLLKEKGDYRDVFTTRQTFLTPLLGSIYGVPVVAPNGGWQRHEFQAGDPRAGIMSQISFLALHSHPGRSSPTLRGKALRELLLCQRVPDPPGNVDFTVVQDTSNTEFKTARERLTAHRTAPACAGCHKIMDPIGLAMENFNSIGEFRTAENGVPIDASGEMDGIKFADPAGLGAILHNSPAATSCLVNKIYTYAVGRPAIKGEAAFLTAVHKDFGAAGYRLPDLMRRIATSPEFYRVAPLQTVARDTPAMATKVSVEVGK
jgi:hypothetical protein